MSRTYPPSKRFPPPPPRDTRDLPCPSLYQGADDPNYTMLCKECGRGLRIGRVQTVRGELLDFLFGD